MKIVYNACFGGFSLSQAGMLRYAEIKGIKLWPDNSGHLGALVPTYWKCPPEDRPKSLDGEAWDAASIDERKAYNEAYSAATLNDRDISRSDPVLVQVAEELGDKASGKCAYLKIRDIPSGTKYRIDEYDGSETVMTINDYEWQVAE